ncbi:MAG: SurA N-terminal domain-containing protein [Oligoflexia bacterium]|nr:SurA N-terminal domain-containing protein [Oligoflexia bacterium]
MLTTWFREKFGTLVVSGIIGLLALAFAISGIFSPSSTRGLHEGAVAGTVNGDPITIQDFQRSYNQRLEFFRQMAGGKMTDEQLKAFNIKGAVFQDLVRRRLMIQEAYKDGLIASDGEVKEAIRAIPAFQEGGKFDTAKYKELLAANNYTPGGFERMVREDLSSERWRNYFQRRARVSDAEAREDFLVTNNKRNIKYVLLTNESGRKGLAVSAEDVQKFLATPAKLNLAKSQYESRKTTVYKGKTFDDVKDQIVRDLVMTEKLPEVQKINNQLADEVLPLMAASKASDAKINALLKKYGAEVRSTGLITAENSFIPGIGQAKELQTDAFAAQSPIDPATGGKAKKYTTGSWILVAIVEESKKPDLPQFEAERGKILDQLRSKKEHELMDSWLRELNAKAKIKPNLSIVGDAEES